MLHKVDTSLAIDKVSNFVWINYGHFLKLNEPLYCVKCIETLLSELRIGLLFWMITI